MAIVVKRNLQLLSSFSSKAGFQKVRRESAAKAILKKPKPAKSNMGSRKHYERVKQVHSTTFDTRVFGTAQNDFKQGKHGRWWRYCRAFMLYR